MSGGEYVLIVEGQDDKHVVRHLCASRQAIPGFCIKDKGGIEKLLKEIGLEILSPGLKAIGILVDANNNPDSRWQAVSDRLKQENVAAPALPDPNGTIIPETDGMPRIGIWLMPNNKDSGELEDFVAKMIPDNDPVWPLVEGYIDGIPASDRKFTEKKTLRAKVHAWLAARESPRQMGVAIRAKDLDATGPLCTAFVAWLRELFELPAEE